MSDTEYRVDDYYDVRHDGEPNVFSTHIVEQWVTIKYDNGCTALRLPYALVYAPIESVRAWFRLLFENKRMNLASIDRLKDCIVHMWFVAKAFGDEDDIAKAQSIKDEFESAAETIEEVYDMRWLGVEDLPF